MEGGAQASTQELGRGRLERNVVVGQGDTQAGLSVGKVLVDRKRWSL
jgi:hypothetical protein